MESDGNVLAWPGPQPAWQTSELQRFKRIELSSEISARFGSVRKRSRGQGLFSSQPIRRRAWCPPSRSARQ